MATASSPAQFRVKLSGFDFAKGDVGAWARKSGGNRTAEVRRYREGGNPDEEVGAGPASRDDMTLSRPWKRTRDQELARRADRQVDRNDRGTITVQPLDEDFNPFGRPYLYEGVLIGCNHPDVDSDATGDTANLELVFATSGVIG